MHDEYIVAECTQLLIQRIDAHIMIYEAFRLDFVVIDYEDYINSRSRKCIPSPGYLPDGVLEYEIVPEIFECVLTEK